MELRTLVIQCAWCNAMRVGPWYVRLPWVRSLAHYWSVRMPVAGTLVLTASHGICPACASQVRESVRRNSRLNRLAG